MASLKSITRSVLGVVLPKSTPPQGTALTQTFNPSATNSYLSVPAYREHLTDLKTTRAASDSRVLIQDMLRTDPDMSAAMNAFLTVANTEPVFLVKDLTGKIDRPGQQLLTTTLINFENRSDYSTGFQMPMKISSLSESLRYMILMRGGIAGELVLSKEYFPTEVRLVDISSLSWKEPAAGQYKPYQISAASGQTISLDIPTFFTSWFRRDPTSIYSYSPFISAINTIAARQQVINDLYRIMQVTGYPRMDIKVLEEVVKANMPPQVLNDDVQRRTYTNSVLGNITNSINSLRPDESFVHTDSIEVDILNAKAPGMGIDITPIIATLNAQNQAGLKTMATIIGRGEAGVNTASVEARIFSLSAQAVNDPIADFYSQALTLALRMQGSQSFVQCKFLPVEMRSAMELEAQKLIQQQRLKDDLSLGLISDDEYHLMVYNRLPPDGTPPLSGTGFAVKATPAVDTTDQPGANNPVARAAQAPGKDNPARDNNTKPTVTKKGA